MRLSRRNFLEQAVLASVAVPAVATTSLPRRSSRPSSTRAEVTLPIRIGMTDWNLGRRGDISKIALAREIGLDGIQVSLIFPTDDTPHLRDPRTQAQFKQAAL